MAEYSQEQIEERFKKLPPVLQDAMFSSEVTEHIIEIGRKYGLNVEKTGFVSEGVADMILGFDRPESFVKNLSEKLVLEPDKVRDIASDINRLIFVPLRESLRQTHQVEITEDSIRKTELHPLRKNLEKAAEKSSPRGEFLKPLPNQEKMPSRKEEIEISVENQAKAQKFFEKKLSVPEKKNATPSIIPITKETKKMGLGIFAPPKSEVIAEIELLSPKKNREEGIQRMTEQPKNIKAAVKPAMNDKEISKSAPPIDLSNQAGAETSQITPTKNYQGSDPYREPIE